MVSFPASPAVRPATTTDVPTVFKLIQALAEYENLSHEVVGTEAKLFEHLFGDRPYIESFLVEEKSTPVGFALFFKNYSAEVGTPGYYLEDLFVFPDYRGKGLGKALLMALAHHAHSQEFKHLQWSVLDWNAPAIAFYQKIGAVVHEHHRIARITGSALNQAAHSAQASSEDRDGSFNTQLTTSKLIDAHQLNLLAESILNHPSKCDPGNNDLQLFLADHSHKLLNTMATDPPGVEAIALHQGDDLVGLATFTHSYSTFLTQPGLFVESLVVAGEYSLRYPLLQALAQIAIERQCGRLEWLVDQNDGQAIAQCQQLGGVVLADWRICRMNEEAIATLASTILLQ